MPSGHKLSDLPSRYQPLFDLLAAAAGGEISLTYKEVAAMVGGPLPESAILHTDWWTRKESRQVQAWRALGWRAHASPGTLRVIFTRDAEEG